jgi:hypothetical protein
MLTFKKFLEVVRQRHPVDASQITRIYDKAALAVELVRLYNPDLLNNITTIADLASGAYGVFNSAENKKIIPPELEQRLIYQGKIPKDKIASLPEIVIRKMFPDVRPEDIKQGDTVHVNVRRIINEKKTDYERIASIASTLVHEITHSLEREMQGKTSESGPEAAEKAFLTWLSANKQLISGRIPGVFNEF